MRHLSPETLARLVDEPAGPEEQEHLRSCSRCADELRAYREQTEALSSLPEIRPPSSGWEELEARLREEGLVRSREPRTGPGRGLLRAGGWLQAAAGVLLFVGGAAVGAVAVGGAGGSGTASRQAPAPRAEAVEAGAASPDAPALEEAAETLRDAEERYRNALVEYRNLLDERGGDGAATDPASRFAALETLVAAGQAAIREAPTDPFLNGVLASTMAERQAVLRRMSASGGDDWF